MKNKLKDYLLEDFECSYHCTVTPEKIMEKTNFFKEKNNIIIVTPYYKREFISSLITIALLVVISITLTCGNYKLNTIINNTDDYKKIYLESINYKLTDEDREFINSYADKTLDNFVFSISLDSYLDLVIYKGYSSLVHYNSENYYFYKIVQKKEINESDDYTIDLKIICDDIEHQISDNNRLGLLSTILSQDSGNLVDNIIIKVINHNVTSNYEINLLRDL